MYRAGQVAPGARLLAAVSLLEGCCGDSGDGQDDGQDGGQSTGAPQSCPRFTVADIGCDHGKLAVFLVQKGVAARVIAVDKRPLPLAKAKGLVLQCGLSQQIECRLGDGLSALSPGEADAAVIAGLSGETIADILAAAEWVKREQTRLVLVPSTRAEVLRVWLAANGFATLHELAVCENGRPYAALCARHTGQTAQLRGLAAELGLLRRHKTPAAIQLAQNRLKDLQNRLLAPLAQAERQALETTIQEVRTWLQ